MTIPSAGQSREGYQAVIRNARRLINAGELLAENGLYGPAISLTVLAAEEAIKSLVLLIISEGLPVEPSLIQQFMKRHKPRHMAAGLWVLFSFLLDKWSNLILDLEQKYSEHDDEYAKERKERVSALADELNAMADAPPGEFSLIDELDWWRDSDDIKQKGFYVDFDQKGWSTPDSFNRSDYDVARITALKALEYAESASKYVDSVPTEDRQININEIISLMDQARGSLRE